MGTETHSNDYTANQKFSEIMMMDSSPPLESILFMLPLAEVFDTRPQEHLNTPPPRKCSILGRLVLKSVNPRPPLSPLERIFMATPYWRHKVRHWSDQVELQTECFNYAREALDGRALDYVLRHQKACLPLLKAIRSKQDWCDAMDAAKVRYHYSRSKRFRSILTPKAIEHALLSVRKSWPSAPKHEELWISVIRRALRRRGRFYRSVKPRKSRFLSTPVTVSNAAAMSKHRTSVVIQELSSDCEFAIDWTIAL